MSNSTVPPRITNYAELHKQVIDAVTLALMQQDPTTCGNIMLNMRDTIAANGLTWEGAIRLFFEWENGSSKTKVNEPVNNKQESKDPDDYWIRPWVELLDNKLIDKRWVQEKDKRQIRRMLEFRHSAPRHREDVVWLFDIARRNMISVPPEYDGYLKRNPPVVKAAE